mgnify:CR=1 FL=1
MSPVVAPTAIPTILVWNVTQGPIPVSQALARIGIIIISMADTTIQACPWTVHLTPLSAVPPGAMALIVRRCAATMTAVQTLCVRLTNIVRYHRVSRNTSNGQSENQSFHQVTRRRKVTEVTTTDSGSAQVLCFWDESLTVLNVR